MSDPEYPATVFAEIDAACAAFAEQERIPGLALGIVQAGRLVHATTVGLADREAGRRVAVGTAFRIASMTKNMTALAILSLRDRGWLQLDAPLAHYVPQFAAVKPATLDSAPVTVRHLLTHTAGFVTDDPWGDRVLGMTPAELDTVIATGHLFARPPGLAFEYSNLGYALLGRVLTNVSGEPYQAYMRRTFLEPLGMAHTTFDAPAAAALGDYAFGYRRDGETWSRERIEPDGEVGAMGGLATTVPDYARYVSFLLSAWPARDAPESGPVRRSSVREMVLWHAPPFGPETAAGARGGQPSAYGYGLTHSTDALLGMRIHHAGGLPGYGSHVLMLPERGWGVFAFGNRTYAPMSRLTLDVAERLHAAPPPALAEPSPALVRAVQAIVAAYASGRIEGGDRPFAVNFLLDTPAPLRDAELASLKQRLGEGSLERIEPIHALAGRFVLACAKGRLNGSITLSPEADSGIQKLVLSVAGA